MAGPFSAALGTTTSVTAAAKANAKHAFFLKVKILFDFFQLAKTAINVRVFCFFLKPSGAMGLSESGG